MCVVSLPLVLACTALSPARPTPREVHKRSAIHTQINLAGAFAASITASSELVESLGEVGSAGSVSLMAISKVASHLKEADDSIDDAIRRYFRIQRESNRPPGPTRRTRHVE